MSAKSRFSFVCSGWTVFCLALATTPVSPACAYVLDGTHWPSNQPIVMNLQLGAPSAALTDGSTTWNQVAAAAMDVWNPSLGDGVQFQANYDNFLPAYGDWRNSVFFSTSAYGESFGNDTIAVTLSRRDASTNTKTEADVIVNKAFSYDSYRGVLFLGGTTTALDLRRVLIHEFGHVLGLSHTDVDAASIMEPYISNFDTTQADDITGVAAIYGVAPHPPTFSASLAVAGSINYSFQYSIVANGRVTQYGAAGLPIGLTVDPATGLIFGSPKESGTFSVTITAANQYGTASTTLTLTIRGLPVITSPLTLSTVAGQPISYTLTASGNPTLLEIGPYSASSLKYDYATATIQGIFSSPGIYNCSLHATNSAGTTDATLTINCSADSGLVTLHAFQYAEGTCPLVKMTQGQDGNLYGMTSQDGALYGGTIYRLTPAGVVTVLYESSGDTGTFHGGAGLTAGNDGNLYGFTGAVYGGGKGTIFKLTPSGEYTTLHAFDETSGYEATALIQGIDGAFYGSARYDTGAEQGGLIFRISVDGGYTVVQRIPGSAPLSSLLQTSDGTFYATAQAVSFGSPLTIVRVTPQGSVGTLCQFSGADYGYLNGLTDGGDGNLYGTASGKFILTSDGPSRTNGVLFRLAPDGALTTIHTFDTTTEGSPNTALVRSPGGFYGTTTGIGAGSGYSGILYQMSPAGTLKVIHTFSAVDGSEAVALCLGPDGYLYGCTGGAQLLGANPNYNYHSGSIFRTTTSTMTTVRPQFFQGEAVLNDGVRYLSFSNGNYFGYYSYLPDDHYIYHFDMGYEYLFDAHDEHSGVYLYDFKSGTFFYTSPTFPFPFLYDFTMKDVLYYFPDPQNFGRYNTGGVRYFYSFNSGKVFSK